MNNSHIAWQFFSLNGNFRDANSNGLNCQAKRGISNINDDTNILVRRASGLLFGAQRVCQLPQSPASLNSAGIISCVSFIVSCLFLAASKLSVTRREIASPAVAATGSHSLAPVRFHSSFNL